MACPEQPDHPGHTVETIPPELAEVLEPLANAVQLFAERFRAQVLPAMALAGQAISETLANWQQPAD